MFNQNTDKRALVSHDTRLTNDVEFRAVRVESEGPFGPTITLIHRATLEASAVLTTNGEAASIAHALIAAVPVDEVYFIHEKAAFEAWTMRMYPCLRDSVELFYAEEDHDEWPGDHTAWITWRYADPAVQNSWEAWQASARRMG